MKGIVFNSLEDFVIQSSGLDVWNQILATTESSSGVYTSAGSYPDAELLALVDSVCRILQIDREAAVRGFGTFLFSSLNQRYPEFSEAQATLFDFLRSVQTAIHIEVRKLYNDPNLPEFDYPDSPANDVLIMRYESPRKMCILAEGLILGAAEHYQQPINIVQDQCIHHGGDYCEFRITLK